MSENATPEMPERIEISPQEAQIIMVYGSIRKAVDTVLTEQERADVLSRLDTLRDAFKNGGDPFRVALQLFVMEVDNTELPYPGRFDKLPMPSFDEAVEIWRKG